MRRIAAISAAALFACLAGTASQAAVAQQTVPSVSIQAERLCTERPPALVALRAETTGLTPPLNFAWNLGDGGHWNEGAEVPERAYEFGRYNVVLIVRDVAGRKSTASMALEVEAAGCGGI